jgi:Fe2+ transport system protein FeoA
LVPLLPLELLGPGEWGEVHSITGDTEWVGRLAELGIRHGCQVQVLQPGSPCLLNVGGCRLSLRGECACQVFVRPVAG